MEAVKPLFDYQKVCDLLPHRPPLLLVDKVMTIDFETLEVHAVKCVTAGEPYLAGHFPGQHDSSRSHDRGHAGSHSKPCGARR